MFSFFMNYLTKAKLLYAYVIDIPIIPIIPKYVSRDMQCQQSYLYHQKIFRATLRKDM